MTSAVVKIEQFDTGDNGGSLHQGDFAASNDSELRQSPFDLQGDLIQGFLPFVSNPGARAAATGWKTESKEDWSDSPANQPFLLYRYRHAWGRDFEDIGEGLDLGAAGKRWGNLDNNSGVLLYERVFSPSSSAEVRIIAHQASARLDHFVTSKSAELEDLRMIGGTDGEVTLEQFPFLLVAVPEPFSIKNPIDTDVFIRMSNFTFPIAPGTITLSLDGVDREPLDIVEFFGGLGGFDVTWTNDFLFDYDAQVDVMWSFFDTDVPANQFFLRYPFFTVPDLAGPRIQNLIPDNMATDIPIAGPIQFDVVDFETGVNIDSLVLYVNNLFIEDGINGTVEITEFTDESGFTIKFTPTVPWLYGDLIPVAFFVEDNAASRNRTFFSYSFTTVESSPPRLLNLNPTACAVDVPTTADIVMDIIDGGHGLNKDTIIITVLEKQREFQLVPIVHRDD